MTIAANLHRTRFFFLHHGETEWDRDGKLAGRINAPLNGRGLVQARRAGEMLRHSRIRTICTSPQDRALMTAEIVAAQIHAPIETIEGLKDCSFGSLDGTAAGGWFDAWQHGVTPDGAESIRKFLARGVRAMNTALERPGPVLIVAHPAIYVAFQRAVGLHDESLTAGDATPILATPILREPQHRRHAGWRTAHLAA
jgi:broad specificity phosphatase PhoE